MLAQLSRGHNREAGTATMDTKTIAHYEILSSIGEGGMGVVYRAVDIRLGRPAAVKLLRHEAATGSEARKRFIQEARAASALNHPHIITIYEIGQDAGVDFIAMEYVAGRTLASLLGQRRLAVDEALRYAIQIADAMSAAHGAGIVHRDLKPGNIMITERDQIKILDFGVAKLTESAELEAMDDQHSTESRRGPDLQTAEGTVLGTTSYMSPEQTEGRPADARSDIFSFGGVLYEMVTGRRAFAGDTSMSTRAAILTRDPEAPGRIVAGLPPDLEKIIARCLRKSPDRRWQSMADLKVALEDLRDESESRRRAPADAPPLSRKRRQVAAAGLVAAALAGVAFGVWRTSRGEAEPDRPPFLKRLTSDVGRTDYPAISLDGRILAYSSDRSREGHLDIWVQHIPDGTPHQLTRDAADEIDPSFSADGSRIAFHSSRRGGGIYVIPTLGGEERLLAARGLNPRFSPDGNWIAYVVVEEGGGRLYVAPANGGPGTPVAPDFYRAHAHVWSPDSRYLLFWGQRRRDPGADGNVDWYVAAVPGGSPVATEARRVLLKEQFQASQGLPLPDVWAGPGNRILFHATVGDSSNIWQVPLKPGSAHVAGAPQRVTFGTTNETAPSVTADGRMVFVSRTIGADLWTLPIDPGTGRPSGPLSRVTEDAADDYRPTLSTNGETLVFRSRRTGHFGVVLRNLLSNAETILTRVPEDHSPAVSPDGSKVAYSHPNGDKMPIFVVGAGGGTPEQVCGDCGEVEEWSSRGDQIVYLNRRDPSGVGILNLGSGHDDAWLQHAGYGIYNPRLSSDGGWIAFNARPDRLSASRVFVARILPSGVAQEQDWIPIASEGDAPAWSPQASLLYFWSDRDGSPCLWAQRLDPATKQPAGTPLLIEHFHNRARSWRNLYLGGPGIAVARDRLVFNLGEHTGNIWITELPRGRE